MESSIQFRRMVQEVYHQSTYLTNRAIKYNGYWTSRINSTSRPCFRCFLEEYWKSVIEWWLTIIVCQYYYAIWHPLFSLVFWHRILYVCEFDSGGHCRAKLHGRVSAWVHHQMLLVTVDTAVCVVCDHGETYLRSFWTLFRVLIFWFPLLLPIYQIKKHENILSNRHGLVKYSSDWSWQHRRELTYGCFEMQDEMWVHQKIRCGEVRWGEVEMRCSRAAVTLFDQHHSIRRKEVCFLVRKLIVKIRLLHTAMAWVHTYTYDTSHHCWSC